LAPAKLSGRTGLGSLTLSALSTSATALPIFRAFRHAAGRRALALSPTSLCGTLPLRLRGRRLRLSAADRFLPLPLRGRALGLRAGSCILPLGLICRSRLLRRLLPLGLVRSARLLPLPLVL